MSEIQYPGADARALRAAQTLLHETEDRCMRLQSYANALEAAIRFYAEPKNYEQSGWQGDPTPTPVMRDRGGLARAVLPDAAR